MNDSSSMTVSEWLQKSVKRLKDDGILTARLDCLVLIEDELHRDRAWLLSHPDYDLQRSEIENLNKKIIQRSQHVPLAYLRGKAEFYGREFEVNAHTLVPRPETETIIELLKSLELPARSTILDVGTGSGCIAITAALELPGLVVSACDIDKQALKTARQNANALHADVTFFESDLLDQAGAYNVITANLPYVPDNFQINTAATHEPRHALFGGPDGLDLYRKLFIQAAELSPTPNNIMAEALPPQHDTLTNIAKVAGYYLEKTDDFIQVFTRA